METGHISNPLVCTKSVTGNLRSKYIHFKMKKVLKPMTAHFYGRTSKLFSRGKEKEGKNKKVCQGLISCHCSFL